MAKSGANLWGRRYAWVVVAKKDGTTFYLTAEETATDIPSRAKQFDTRSDAEAAARKARSEKAWAGYDWHKTEAKVSEGRAG